MAPVRASVRDVSAVCPVHNCSVAGHIGNIVILIFKVTCGEKKITFSHIPGSLTFIHFEQITFFSGEEEARILKKLKVAKKLKLKELRAFVDKQPSGLYFILFLKL